jgi:hypothetical protein
MPNEWFLVLNGLSAIAGCAQEFFNNLFCSQCQILSAFTKPLVDAIVQWLLVPLNIFIHIDKVVTTSYFGTCVDFRTPIRRTETFVDAVANAIESFSEFISGVPCPTVTLTGMLDTDSATFLCATAGAFRFGFRALLEILLQLTIVLQIVIVGLVSIAGSLPADEVLLLFRQLNFTNILNDIQLFVLELTAIVMSIFVPSFLFCDASTTQNVRSTLANAFGSLLGDIILLIPRIFLDVIDAIITGLSSSSVAGVIATLSNVLSAGTNLVLDVIGNLFIQLANVFNCLTAANPFSAVLKLIGDFFQSEGLHTAVSLIFVILIDLIALIIGLFQVIITGDSQILAAAAQLLAQIVGQLILLLFGFNASCSFQDFVCIATPSFQFVVTQCLAGDRTTNPPSPPFEFHFCRPEGRPGSLGCFFQNQFVCGDPFHQLAQTDCPPDPFGCCGSSPFPADGTIPVINNECASCPPCNVTGEFCDSRDRCQFVLTPGVAFNSTPGFPALLTAIGQAALDHCPKFQSLIECDNVTLLNNDGTPLAHSEIVRARPFGLRLAATTGGKRFLSTELCENVIAEYGLDRVAALVAPLRRRNAELQQRALANISLPLDAVTFDAVQCYFRLYPEMQSVPLAPKDQYQFMLFSGSGALPPQSPSSTSLATGFMQTLSKSFENVRAAGYELYKANKATFMTAERQQRRQHRLTQWTTSAARRTAMWPQRLTTTKNSMAKFLRGVGIPHSVEERERARPLTRALFESFAQYQQQRIADFNADVTTKHHTNSLNNNAGLLAHGVALVFHVSDLVEHFGFFMHYHLNLRPVNEHLLYARKTVTASSAARRDALLTELAEPTVVGAMQTWLGERRDTMVKNSLGKLRSLLRSTGYVKSTAQPTRWSDLRFHRHARADFHHHQPHTLQRGTKKPILLWSPPQHVAAAQRNFVTSATFNSSELAAALGIGVCDPNVQAFCTDCLVLDNIVLAIGQIVNSTRDFYTEPDTGFHAAVAQFEATIFNTLIDPVGPDTFTTANPRTPFLFRRFLPTNASQLTAVNTFFTWNYTEFRSIVYGNPTGTPPPVNADVVGSSAKKDTAIAASQNRTDSDLIFLNLTSPITTPAISFLETLTAQIQQVGVTQVGIRLIDRYIICDYTSGPYCKSEHAVGLFDGIVNVFLILFIVGAIIAFIPGVGSCVVAIYAMFGILIFVPLLWWIAYDAQPLCTLPSFVGGVPSVPVCGAQDLQRLFEELVPECPPIPAGLIDPAFLAQASVTLCGTEGTVPPLLLCSEAAGFIDGFDNIFWTISTVFGANVSLSIADQIQMVAPSIAQVARIYTQEHLEALNAKQQLGAICNIFTFFNIFAALAVLTIAIFASVGFLALAAFLIGVLIIAIIIGIYANYIIWLQMRKAMFAWLMRFYGSKQKTE